MDAARMDAHLQDAQGKKYDMNDPADKKHMEDTFADADQKMKELEKNRRTREIELEQSKKEHLKNKGNSTLKGAYEAKQKAYIAHVATYAEEHRNLSEIREAMDALKNGRAPKIKITDHHYRTVK